MCGFGTDVCVTQNGVAILDIYESEFNKLSDRYFTEYPWPEVARIVPFLQQGQSPMWPLFRCLHFCVCVRKADDTFEIFQVLYKELYFRHIYAKHKVSTCPHPRVVFLSMALVGRTSEKCS